MAEMKILAIIGDVGFIQSIVGSQNTKRTLDSLWRNWLEDRTDLSPEELVNFWINSNLKPETIRKLLSLYKQWYYWQYKEDIKLTKLVRKVSRMKGATEVKAWSKEEAKKALNVAKNFDPELHKIMVVALHTGARKGELMGLKWEDIDFTNKRINIKRSWDGPTKTGKPRSIPMSDSVAEILRDCYNGNRGSYCFRWFDPNPRLKRICKMAGVREITMHGARHSFCSWALCSGKNPRIVADLAGHSTPAITMSTYWDRIQEKVELDFLDGI